MLNSKPTATKSSSPTSSQPSLSSPPIIPAISLLKFPFKLTKDQMEAVDSWTTNGFRGSIIYSTGTGKTEIAFECAKRACEAIEHKEDNNSSFNILFLVPRIVLVQQNIDRLIRYGIAQARIGAYFGERKQERALLIYLPEKA